MSKSRSTINDFFRCYRPENETHELAIAQFCAKRRFVISIDGTPDKREPITYELFKQWFEMETPQRGDIVTLREEGITGIVDGVGINRAICLFLSFKDGILDTVHRSFHYTSLEPAAEETIRQMQRALYREGLIWNQWRNRIKPREIPKENIQYQISVLGRKIGYGVFREIDPEGRIVMYCVKMEGEPVRYSLREVIGPVENYQLESINVNQREDLALALKQAGVVWNGFYKRIDPIGYRLPVGKHYYYLNEFWEVCKTAELGKSRNDKYFTSGNYSRSKEDMDAVRRHLLELAQLPVTRTEGDEYYYLKEFWKTCKTTDKGRSRDIKRAKCGNRFSTEEEAMRIVSSLQQKRNEQLAQYRSKR